MKAIVYKEYGSPDVLHVEDVAKPTVRDNEVLVRVRATAINFGDLTARNFKAVTFSKFWMPEPLWLPSRLYFGFNKPKRPILGSEFAGDVEAVGKDVTRFKVGDAVFGYRGQSMGAYAEYLAVRENSPIEHKPHNMSYEEAAALPYGAMTAWSLLQKANIQPGQKVLINGASGAIGSYAVQIAKHQGAEVTGVCGTRRFEFVKALGADHVIDYKKEDFTQNGETYDLIFDVLGKGSYAKLKNSLTPSGRYFLVSFKTKQVFQMLWTKLTSQKKVVCALSSDSLDDLTTVTELAEAGVLKSIVDRCYPMEQAAAGHRYIEDGHKAGHVVITL